MSTMRQESHPGSCNLLINSAPGELESSLHLSPLRGALVSVVAVDEVPPCTSPLRALRVLVVGTRQVFA